MNTRRRMIGVVTSDKMQKTVVVEIERTFSHRLYKKVVHARRRVMAHDELGCQMGDHVQIVESRPLSRNKHWVVEAILRREVGAGKMELVEEVIEKPVEDAVEDAVENAAEEVVEAES
jgi:small subunit ribosomal protein S17